jgi:hypothetical protein
MSSSDESMLPSLEEADECVFEMDSEPPSAPQAIAMHHQSPYHILEVWLVHLIICSYNL